jgi:ATP-dependent DNA ligase
MSAVRPNWVHEIKLDGFRMMVRRDPAGVRLLTASSLGAATVSAIFCMT